MDDSPSSPPASIWTSLNSWFTSTVFFVLLNVMIATIVFTSNLPNNNQQNHRRQEHEEEEKRNSQNHHHEHNDLNQPQIARSHSILHRLKSFNFLPQRPLEEFSPENHRQQDPLQVAATQYVFNQPLDYQHFDYDFDPTGSANTPAANAAVSAAQFSTHDAPHPFTETHVVWEHEQIVETGNTSFNFEPTQEEIQSDKGFEDAHEEQTDEFQSLDEVYSKLKSGHHDRTKSESALSSKPPAKMKKSASLKVGFAHLEEEEIVEARRPVTVRERKSAARVTAEDDVEVDAKAADFINKFKNDLKLQRIESIMKTKGSTGRGTAK